jgi:hypothetical protein
MHYKFLIYISYSYALPIGNPLEAEILKRGDTVNWFSDLEDGKVAIKNKDNVLNTIEDVVNYEPQIVLGATNDVPDFVSGLKVQIFHGFFSQKRPEGNDKFAHFRIRGFFDLYCTQGPTSTVGFEKLQKKFPHFEVRETGWSKVDPLFPITIKEKGNKPTIMIASTFSKRLSLALHDDVYETIKHISSTGKYNFLMVLHPKLPNETKEKWRNLNNDNFTYYDTTDLAPLFKKSDILFADTTSAIQEYLVQKKPVVTYRHTFNHNYLINIEKPEAIENAFDEALRYPQSLIENIEAFVSQLHPYSDGKSSKRVIETCISFLHKDKSHLKSKPLNLIRKYKIRKRLGYFSFKSYSKGYTLKK